jgi:hypothetical protein
MTREKENQKRWISIGVDRAQVDHIDRAIRSLKVFGKPKYESRQAFVSKAVQSLLEEETGFLGVQEFQEEVIAR